MSRIDERLAALGLTRNQLAARMADDEGWNVSSASESLGRLVSCLSATEPQPYLTFQLRELTAACKALRCSSDWLLGLPERTTNTATELSNFLTDLEALIPADCRNSRPDRLASVRAAVGMMAQRLAMVTDHGALTGATGHGQQSAASSRLVLSTAPPGTGAWAWEQMQRGPEVWVRRRYWPMSDRVHLVEPGLIVDQEGVRAGKKLGAVGSPMWPEWLAIDDWELCAAPGSKEAKQAEFRALADGVSDTPFTAPSAKDGPTEEQVKQWRAMMWGEQVNATPSNWEELSGELRRTFCGFAELIWQAAREGMVSKPDYNNSFERLVDIVDENFGRHPVMTPEELMTALDSELLDARTELGSVRKRVGELETRCEAAELQHKLWRELAEQHTGLSADDHQRRAVSDMLDQRTAWESWCADMVYRNPESHRIPDEHQGRQMLTARLDDYYKLNLMFPDRGECEGPVPPIYAVTESLIGRLRSDLKHERAELERVKAEFGAATRELEEWNAFTRAVAPTNETTGPRLRAAIAALLAPAGDEVTETKAAAGDVIRAAMLDAEKRYWGEQFRPPGDEPSFNSANFGVALNTQIGHRGGLDGNLVRAILSSRADVREHTLGSAHWVTMDSAEVTEEEARALSKEASDAASKVNRNPDSREWDREYTHTLIRLARRNHGGKVTQQHTLPLSDTAREELAKIVYPIVYTTESYARGLHQTSEAFRGPVYQAVDAIAPRIARVGVELRELTAEELNVLANTHLSIHEGPTRHEVGCVVVRVSVKGHEGFARAILAAAQGVTEPGSDALNTQYQALKQLTEDLGISGQGTFEWHFARIREAFAAAQGGERMHVGVDPASGPDETAYVTSVGGTVRPSTPDEIAIAKEHSPPRGRKLTEEQSGRLMTLVEAYAIERNNADGVFQDESARWREFTSYVESLLAPQDEVRVALGEYRLESDRGCWTAAEGYDLFNASEHDDAITQALSASPGDKFEFAVVARRVE